LISCSFVSDLHGHIDRYHKLFDHVAREHPAALFIGGDILPSAIAENHSGDGDFINDFLKVEFNRLRDNTGPDYPRIFLILGNDDGRYGEKDIIEMDNDGLWTYVHGRRVMFDQYQVYGYAYIPPSPYLLKDWERYDISRYVDPGCISPEEGIRTVTVSVRQKKHATIETDLKELTGDDNLDRAVCLFHTPPYRTNLDRADLEGVMVDHVPLDISVGSIAVRRFIGTRQPLVTLHGHIHESTRLTGTWRDRIGRTLCFTAAHDGPELAVVRFDLDCPENAERVLI